MNEDVKQAVSDLANALQTIDLLSTRLRESLGESAQQAVFLDGAALKAVGAMKRLQPTQRKKR